MNKIDRAIEGLKGLSQLLVPFFRKVNFEGFGEVDALEFKDDIEFGVQALIEKQKREQGCTYCKVPYKDIIDIILGESVSGEEVHLFINTDGQNLRLYDNLPDNPKTDILKIGYCPMCGRRLSHD